MTCHSFAINVWEVIEAARTKPLVAILTDRLVFGYSMIAKHSSIILDTRNALKEFSRPDFILL